MFSFAESRTVSISNTKFHGEINSEKKEPGGKPISRQGRNVIEYENNDGSITREISLRAVNFKDSSGRWREIQTDIIPGESGSFINRTNSLKTRFADGLKKRGIEYEGEKGVLEWKLESVSFVDTAGKPLYKSDRQSAAAFLKKSNKIHYEEIFANVTDEYITAPNRVKNNIIINRLPKDMDLKKAEYLKIEGVFTAGLFSSLMQGGKKTNTLETKRGFKIRVNETDDFDISPVIVYDSAPEQKAGVLKKTGQAVYGTYKIKKKFNRVNVEILVDAKWLLAPERQFPVIIDPTVSLSAGETQYQTLTYDTDIYSSDADSNYGEDNLFLVGREAPGNATVRALMRFGEVDSIPSTATVKYAYLNLYLYSAHTDSIEEDWIEIHEMSRPWVEGTSAAGSGATWNTYDGSNTWTNPGGDFYDAVESRKLLKKTPEERWDAFNITPLVEKWAAGTPNNGIILKATDEREASTTDTFLLYYNSYDAVENFPVLKVVYYYARSGEFYDGNKAASSSGYAGMEYTNISFPYTQSSPAQIDWGDMLVGGDASVGGPFRSYVAFDLSSLPKNITVTDASVDLYLYARMGNSQQINMHLLTNEWHEKGVSWVSRTAESAWGSAGGDFDALVEGSITPANMPDMQHYRFNISQTSKIEEWINGISPNTGFMFKSSAEGANARGYFFYNFDANEFITAETDDPSNYMPRLNITFTAAAGFTPPEIITPKTGEIIDDVYIIQWRQGSQSSLADPLDLTYEIEYTDDNGTSWYPIYTTAAKADSYEWDVSSLADGNSYSVRIRAFDGAVYSDYHQSGIFSVKTGETKLKIMSLFNTPSTLQAGDVITIVMEIANTYKSEAFTILPTELYVNQVSGGGAVSEMLNEKLMIESYRSKTFTWVYRTTGEGTINFSGEIEAVGGDGDSGFGYNTVDTNALTKTAKYTGSDIVILYSTPSETPTVFPTATITPTSTPGSIAQAVDNYDFVWTFSGTGEWFMQTTTFINDGDAAQSALITDSQYTAMETTVTGPGTFSFYYRVDSELDYDFFHFYVNSTLELNVSGFADWTQYSVELPAGDHVLGWNYNKDDSVSEGADAAWVDWVAFEPSMPTST
ncbi:MAG: DNRLRE domain-containing protein, partial [bacterium]